MIRLKRCLGRYLPEVDPQAKLHIEHKLEMAFLHTFPQNICMSADESNEYPFYIMVKDKQLLKVHGSSVMTEVNTKMPKFVCCQNLVLSTITHRPMAKVIVPIDEKLLSTLSKVEYRKALQMDKENLPQKEYWSEVPTAFLRYLRGKNHNEYIQGELCENKAHLESDENREKIIYFYLRSKEAEEDKRLQIIEMKERIADHAREDLAKRPFLFNVSDKTKMQVDGQGKIIDVLMPEHYLSFMIKTYHSDYSDKIAQSADNHGIAKSSYYIAKNKDRNYTIVTFSQKRDASRVFHDISKAHRHTGIAMFPLCGFTSDYGSKFRRWKVDLIWYESPKARNARVYINLEKEQALEFLGRLKECQEFELKPNFSEKSPPGNYFADISDVISNREDRKRLTFKEELDLDDYIRKLIPEHRNSFNIVVQRQGAHLYEGQESCEEDEEAQARQREIEHFLAEEGPVDKRAKKEMRFVAECGMDRGIVRDLDIPMREELEKIFPVLRNYNVLVFKAKRNTTRRAQIYPNEGGYGKFMDVMKQFLGDHNGTFIPKLESKLRVAFRGKYVIKIDEDCWRNFMTTIEACIKRFGLTHKLRRTLKKRELTIEAPYDKVTQMRSCVKEIMGLLFPKAYDFKDPYDMYGFKLDEGRDEISKLNNKNSGRAACWLDTQRNKLFIRGEKERKEKIFEALQQWLKIFNSKVKTLEFPMTNPRAYFRNSKDAKEHALNHKCLLSHSGNKLRILYNEYSAERTFKKDNADERKRNVDDLIAKLKSLFEKDNRIPIAANVTTEDIKCRICGNVIDEKYRLVCSHLFCHGCLKYHILDSKSLEITCPEPGCNHNIILMDLSTILTAEELREVFMRLKGPFLSANSDKYKMCPTPDCDNILCSPEISGSTYTAALEKEVVVCDSCGSDYCFKCLTSHYDTDCEKNKAAEVISCKAKQPPTKQQPPAKKCPACRNVTESQNGCNVVFCQTCQTAFCLACPEVLGKQADSKAILRHEALHASTIESE